MFLNTKYCVVIFSYLVEVLSIFKFLGFKIAWNWYLDMISLSDLQLNMLGYNFYSFTESQK